jgi:carboxylesterase type B
MLCRFARRISVANIRLPQKLLKKVIINEIWLIIATGQFNDLCEALEIPISTPTPEKLSRLRAVPSPKLLSTILTLKLPTFRATEDNIIISKSIFKQIHSGELARRFYARQMKLLIGEVEHEEVMYAIGAPTSQATLLPRLENYYRSSVAKALVEHYQGVHENVERMYTEIVTDVQVRATTRDFSRMLVEGGVLAKDILRYRISLPIKAEDESLPEAHKERFQGKVPHGFDFLHWW